MNQDTEHSDDAPGASRSQAASSNAGNKSNTGDKPTRKRGKRVLVGVVAVCALVFAGWFAFHWWTVGRFIETTDDAYVQADIVGLSAQVSGTVRAVPVDDNQFVGAGEVLIEIDDREYRAALAQAQASVDASEATLANTVQQRVLQQRTIEVDQADLATARANASFAQADFERTRKLRRSGTATERRLQETQTSLTSARGALAKAQAVVARDTQRLAVLDTQKRQGEAERERAKASRQVAELNLEHTVVRAPEAGIVGNREVEPGEYVRPGMRLVSVVPTADVYVIANFKETQIEYFRRGMDVDIESDMLGGRAVGGTIDSLAPASGAEFAILPPQNATGNFTKIVQRVPVKIRLDRHPEAGSREDRHPEDRPGLKPGTSVIVSIDTKSARK